MTVPAFDVVSKVLYGPLVTTQSGSTTWARLFVADGKFYVAESDSKGRRVRSVHQYPMPDGEPNHGTRRWGEWSWKTCGCGHSWYTHSLDSLVAQAIAPEALVTGAEGIEVPAGDMESRLAWIAETDDMAERKARATAIYEHESDSGADLDGLDELLDSAVYGENTSPIPERAEA